VVPMTSMFVQYSPAESICLLALETLPDVEICILPRSEARAGQSPLPNNFERLTSTERG